MWDIPLGILSLRRFPKCLLPFDSKCAPVVCLLYACVSVSCSHARNRGLFGNGLVSLRPHPEWSTVTSTHSRFDPVTSTHSRSPRPTVGSTQSFRPSRFDPSFARGSNPPDFAILLPFRPIICSRVEPTRFRYFATILTQTKTSSFAKKPLTYLKAAHETGRSWH